VLSPADARCSDRIACVARRSVRNAIQKQTAAIGSSNTSARTIAVPRSLPWLSRTMSNHASVRSSVPVAVANAPAQAGERRYAATAVPQKQAASPTSNPDHARSQCADRWVAASDDESQNAHGSSPMPIAP